MRVLRVVTWGLIVAGLLACAPLGRAIKGSVPDAGGGALEDLEFQSRGESRSASLHVPKKASSRPRALIIMLHGGGPESDPERGRVMSPAWRKHFTDEDLVFAFPNSNWKAKGTWYDNDDEDKNRDIDMLHDLVDAVAKKVEIDRSRVYLAGFSGGAGFTWYVQCKDPGPYAGFAMLSCPKLSQAQVGDCPHQPIRPVFYLHGGEDKKIPLTGGKPDPDLPPASDSWDFMLETRRCDAKPRTEPRVPGQNGVVAEGKVYSCREVESVEIWVAEGQGHCVSRALDPDCGGYEVSDLVIDYWKRAAGL